jgi:hypothetical protein
LFQVQYRSSARAVVKRSERKLMSQAQYFLVNCKSTFPQVQFHIVTRGCCSVVSHGLLEHFDSSRVPAMRFEIEDQSASDSSTKYVSTEWYLQWNSLELQTICSQFERGRDLWPTGIEATVSSFRGFSFLLLRIISVQCSFDAVEDGRLPGRDRLFTRNVVYRRISM